LSSSVLDASAILAWLRDEPGADTVTPLLAGAAVSAVNWSEVAQKLGQYGANTTVTAGRLRALGVRVEPFTAGDALAAAALWRATRTDGLSLADRACLALAQRLGIPAITADRAWSSTPGLTELGVTVRVIR
jgi:PIN domain nuclease of toxin-antitoxin system